MHDIPSMETLTQNTTVKLYTYYQFSGSAYFVHDYNPPEFFSSMHKRKLTALNDEQVLKYCYEILVAIKKCHDKNIAYNDISTSNFIFDKDGRIKICDLNINLLCNMKTEKRAHNSILFNAPEVFGKKEYNPIKSDIWSIGVSFFYLATGFYPFFSRDAATQIRQINTGIYPIFLIESGHLREVIMDCLNVNPEERFSVDELLALTYFDSLKAKKEVQKNRIRVNYAKTSMMVNPFIQKMSQMKQTRISRVPYIRRAGVLV